MSFASKHNRGNKFSIDTTGYTYKRIADVVADNGMEHTYRVAALYINTKGKFDDHPVAVLPDIEALVDLPSHMTAEVQSILQDAEDIASIEAGKVGIKFEKYVSKTYGRECIGCRWVDVQ
jgi:hypothetical protein